MPLAFPRAQRTFTGSLEQLESVRAFVSETASQLGWNEDDTFAFELASDEAATNVFKYAFEGKPGALQVELWREGNAGIVQMKYRGRAFDPASVPEPNLDVSLPERPLGGLGLYFMRQLMTQIEFEFDAGNGNVLTMRRVLAPESRG